MARADVSAGEVAHGKKQGAVKSIADGAETDEDDVYLRSNLLCYSYLPDEPDIPDEPFAADWYNTASCTASQDQSGKKDYSRSCSPVRDMDRLAEERARVVDETKRLAERCQLAAESSTTVAAVSSEPVPSPVPFSVWDAQCQAMAPIAIPFWRSATETEGLAHSVACATIMAMRASGLPPTVKTAMGDLLSRATSANTCFKGIRAAYAARTSWRRAQHVNELSTFCPIKLEIGFYIEKLGSEQSFFADDEDLELEVCVCCLLTLQSQKFNLLVMRNSAFANEA